MKCNNTHCKYYRPAEHIVLFGIKGIKEGGCKYPYCKKKEETQKWKKDLKEITKYLKNNVKKSDIKADFAIKYPEVDLSIL